MGWTARFQFPAGARDLSIPHIIWTSSPLDTRALSSGLKWLACEAYHLPAFSAEFTNDGAIPPFPATSVWHHAYLIKHRDMFTFTLQYGEVLVLVLCIWEVTGWDVLEVAFLRLFIHFLSLWLQLVVIDACPLLAASHHHFLSQAGAHFWLQTNQLISEWELLYDWQFTVIQFVLAPILLRLLTIFFCYWTLLS